MLDTSKCTIFYIVFKRANALNVPRYFIVRMYSVLHTFIRAKALNITFFNHLSLAFSSHNILFWVKATCKTFPMVVAMTFSPMAT